MFGLGHLAHAATGAIGGAQSLGSAAGAGLRRSPFATALGAGNGGARWGGMGAGAGGAQVAGAANDMAQMQSAPAAPQGGPNGMAGSWGRMLGGGNGAGGAQVGSGMPNLGDPTAAANAATQAIRRTNPNAFASALGGMAGKIF